VFLGGSNNDRQPEEATETGNTYVSETTTVNVEIPSDCDNEGQPKMARLAPKTSIYVYCHLRLSVIVAITWRHLPTLLR